MLNDYKKPTPGLALVMASEYVSAVTAGPKGGGRWCGAPLAVSATTTQIRRPDGVIMRLPNTSVAPESGPWVAAALRAGANPFTDNSGWEWLAWTIADHAEAERAAAATPLVFITCGARKQTTRSRAADQYVGTYFKLALQAARRIVPEDRIRIISALHGILPLHRVIAPYNVRLGDPTAITAPMLRQQARSVHLHRCSDVTVLGGNEYSHLIQQVWPHAHAPLAGSRGIGEQQHRLVNIGRQ